MKPEKIKCRNCGKLFRPNKYNQYHQHYCQDSPCHKASKIASDKKYRRKVAKSLAYRQKESERVQAWQKKHPNYYKSRSKKSSKKISDNPVLRDIVQVEKLEKDIGVLRDIVNRQQLIFQGFISKITGDVLREDIGIICNRLYDRGNEVSGAFSGTE